MFLSLWSQAGVSCDQGGKEVADLLVVFGDHVVIFSDKDCAFPDTGDTQVDWRRWYRKAIAKSAEQVFGTERWIGNHPDRFFLDRACTQRFPLPLPDPSAAKVHRVVVAHGVAERCRRELGGSGGLRIVPAVVGAMHTAPPEDGGRPFAIGQVDPARGYVHVLDDASLDTVMAGLDTVSDFVAYLSEKERLILGGRLAFAASEADLLAYYLYPDEGKDRNGFVVFPASGAKRLAGRLELHHPPAHGSWPNMAEPESADLQTQCLDRRVGDRAATEREVSARTERRDAASSTIRWQFTTADARIKLKRLYPAVHA